MCIDNRLVRGLHFLFAGAGQRQGEIRLAHVDAGLVDLHPLLEVGIFKAREQSALLHLLALFDGQIDDAPLHLETDQALVGFNVAGERELIRRRRFLVSRG